MNVARMSYDHTFIGTEGVLVYIIRSKDVHTIKGCLYDINSLHPGVHANIRLALDCCSKMHAIVYVASSFVLAFV
jgi:hypothetical protein